MNRKWFITIGVCVLAFVLCACAAADETIEANPLNDSELAAEMEVNTKDTRIIKDLAGNDVVLPPADEIEKVVIIAPPLLATYVNVVGDTNKLVGLHPRCLHEANPELLNLVVPNWADINTGFIKGFTSNTEELLKMNPDVILVYGDFQKEGLENIDVPIVDFFIQDTQNEVWSVAIDGLMREIFEIEGVTSLQDEWNEANKIVAEALSELADEDKKIGLMIRSIDQNNVLVRGANYYGDDWMKKTGLINAASDCQGDSAQVSMEQIYGWNPAVIYDFVGMDADRYLANEIEGQDWTFVEAYSNHQIYDMPRGMFNWGSPNVESPLALIWMTMKNYPDKIDQDFFNGYMKAFYDRQYGVELTDQMMAAILDPQK